MNTDKHRSAFICTTKVQILCRLERILLRGFFALFASSRLIPDSAFTAKTRSRKENAKQIVWLAARLSLCSSVVSLIVLDLDGLHGVNPCPIRVPFPHGAVLALCASMIPTFTGMSEATGSPARWRAMVSMVIRPISRGY